MWYLLFPISKSDQQDLRLLCWRTKSHLLCWNNALGKENAPLLPPHSLLNSKTEGRQASQNPVLGKAENLLAFQRMVGSVSCWENQQREGIQLSAPLGCFSGAVVKEKSTGRAYLHWTVKHKGVDTQSCSAKACHRVALQRQSKHHAGCCSKYPLPLWQLHRSSSRQVVCSQLSYLWAAQRCWV